MHARHSPLTAWAPSRIYSRTDWASRTAAFLSAQRKPGLLRVPYLHADVLASRSPRRTHRSPLRAALTHPPTSAAYPPRGRPPGARRCCSSAAAPVLSVPVGSARLANAAAACVRIPPQVLLEPLHDIRVRPSALDRVAFAWRARPTLLAAQMRRSSARRSHCCGPFDGSDHSTVPRPRRSLPALVVVSARNESVRGCQMRHGYTYRALQRIGTMRARRRRARVTPSPGT